MTWDHLWSIEWNQDFSKYLTLSVPVPTLDLAPQKKNTFFSAFHNRFQNPESLLVSESALFRNLAFSHQFLKIRYFSQLNVHFFHIIMICHFIGSLKLHFAALPKRKHAPIHGMPLTLFDCILQLLRFQCCIELSHNLGVPRGACNRVSYTDLWWHTLICPIGIHSEVCRG